jgi:hypothetical protein
MLVGSPLVPSPAERRPSPALDATAASVAADAMRIYSATFGFCSIPGPFRDRLNASACDEPTARALAVH